MVILVIIGLLNFFITLIDFGPKVALACNSDVDCDHCCHCAWDFHDKKMICPDGYLTGTTHCPSGCPYLIDCWYV